MMGRVRRTLRITVPLLEQFVQAVTDRDFVDADQGVPVASHCDVAEAQTLQKRPFEAADAQSRREVLVGLADNQIANPILRPPGLDHREAEEHDRQDQGDDADDCLRERG